MSKVLEITSFVPCAIGEKPLAGPVFRLLFAVADGKIGRKGGKRREERGRVVNKAACQKLNPPFKTV